MDTRTQVRTLARSVAGALGYTYATLAHDKDDTYPTVRMIAPDGLPLTVSLRDGRAWFGAECTLDREASSHGLSRPSVSVDPARDPSAIARDLTRRLVPDAREYAAEVARRNESCREWRDNNAQTAQALASMGLNWRKSDNGGEQALYGPHGLHLRTSGENVRFEYFSVPLPLALEIVRVVQAYAAQHGAGVRA